MARISASGGRPLRGLVSHGIRRGAFVAVAIAALIIGAGLGVAGCTFEFGSGPDTTLSPASTVTTDGAAPDITTATTARTTSTIAGSGTVVAEGDGIGSPAQAVASILAPSVVNIATSGMAVYSQGPWQQEYEYAYQGSGVIYTVDGMIVTNNHVVTEENGEVADNIEVTLTTGEKLTARVVGNDPLTDLAVIKVDPSFDLPVATFVTGEPSVGEYAVAIGSPLGYENSVSLGIVSGLNRSIDQAQGYEGIALTNLVQTDAPISPGNSGGALANAAGQVIGINVAYESPASGAVSIGFAIPSVVVVQVADEIISTGKATHAYIGVGTRAVDAELQKQFGLSRSSGILVAEVTANGPAGKAGIMQGDIIIEVDGEEMVESSDLLIAIRDRKPGDVVEVVIDRDGREMTFSVALEERPLDLY